MDADTSIVGVGLAALVHLGASVWWASKMSTHVEENSRRVGELEDTSADAAKLLPTIIENTRRIGGLEAANAAALESGRLVAAQLARIDERTSIMLQRTDAVAEQRIRQAAGASP